MCTWWPSIVCTCATASTYAFPTLSVTVTLCPVEDMRTNAMIRFPTVLPVGNVTDTDPTPDPSIAFDCTRIETGAGAVTVSRVVPLTLPTVAVIVVGPGARVVAAPVALIVATVVADELHVAVAVKSAVVPSLFVPLAVNCCGVPFTTEGFAGVTARDVSTGTLAGLNVAKTAVQLVLGLTLNVAAYAPVEVTATASLPARDVFVSCCNIVYPLPAVTVPV